MISITKDIKAQSGIEVALALTLALVIIIGAVCVWHWLNASMLQRYGEYSASRLAAIKKRDNFYFGQWHPLPLLQDLTMSSMDLALGDLPDQMDPGLFPGCSDITDDMNEQSKPHWTAIQELQEVMTDYDTRIMNKKGELQMIRVEVYRWILVLWQQEETTSLGNWIYDDAPGTGGGLDDFDQGAWDQYLACVEHCKDHPDECDWQTDCEQPEDDVDFGDIVQESSIQNNSFTQIRSDFQSKYNSYPQPQYRIDFFAPGPVDVNYVHNIINEGEELENEKRTVGDSKRADARAIRTIEVAGWRDYYNCLRDAAPECMNYLDGDQGLPCGTYAQQAQALLGQAYDVLVDTVDRNAFSRARAAATEPEVRFQYCYKECKMQMEE